MSTFHPSIAGTLGTLVPGLAQSFRPNLNSYIGSVEAKARLIMGWLEAVSQAIGPGAISGGSVAAATGTDCTVAAGTAIVGSYVTWNAGTITGFPSAGTAKAYVRQDGTWTVGTAGTPAADTTHGYALEWATVITAAGAVSSVNQARRMFAQNVAQVYPYAGTPPVLQSGDLWFDTVGSALKQVSGTIVYSVSGTPTPVGTV